MQWCSSFWFSQVFVSMWRFTDYWLLITGANSLFYSTTEKYINVPIREDKRCVSWVDPNPTRTSWFGSACGSHRMTLKKKKKNCLGFFFFWSEIEFFFFNWIRRLKFYYEYNNLITSWIRVYLRKKGFSSIQAVKLI